MQSSVNPSNTLGCWPAAGKYRSVLTGQEPQLNKGPDWICRLVCKYKAHIIASESINLRSKQAKLKRFVPPSHNDPPLMVDILGPGS